MIHSWELALNELALPLIGFYLGNKINKPCGVILALLGYAWAERALYTALVNHWVVK